MNFLAAVILIVGIIGAIYFGCRAEKVGISSEEKRTNKSIAWFFIALIFVAFIMILIGAIR